MYFRRFFITAVMLFAGIILCAEANLVVDHQVSPSEIYSMDSGRDPIECTVLLTVTGKTTADEIPVRAVLAIDSSGSMEETDSEGHRISAAKSFVNMMNSSKDLVGVVSWDDNIDFVLPLTNDFTEAINKIDEVDSGDGTNMDAGLKAAVDLLVGDSNASDVIVFLTDGNGEYTPSGASGSQADRARDEGIVIYSIGLNVSGTDAEASLNDMATATGGKYYSAPESESLELIYEEISREVISVAGRDVNVKYVIPADLIPHNYSIEPNSNISEDDTSVLTWNLGTISIGETQEIFFNVSSFMSGSFDLGGASVASTI
jgi:Ca-activated chloride channel family protein